MVDEVVGDVVEVVVVVVEVGGVVVVTGGGPVDTTMLTELDGGTDEPAPGLVAMTWPAAYWDDASGVVPPKVRPYWVRRVRAACWSRPMSEGTSTLA